MSCQSLTSIYQKARQKVKNDSCSTHTKVQFIVSIGQLVNYLEDTCFNLLWKFLLIGILLMNTFYYFCKKLLNAWSLKKSARMISQNQDNLMHLSSIQYCQFFLNFTLVIYSVFIQMFKRLKRNVIRSQNFTEKSFAMSKVPKKMAIIYNNESLWNWDKRLLLYIMENVTWLTFGDNLFREPGKTDIWLFRTKKFKWRMRQEQKQNLLDQSLIWIFKVC